jgi:hypothetical protein
MFLAYELLVTRDTTVDSPFELIPVEPHLQTYMEIDVITSKNPRNVRQVSEVEFIEWTVKTFL